MPLYENDRHDHCNRDYDHLILRQKYCDDLWYGNDHIQNYDLNYDGDAE